MFLNTLQIDGNTVINMSVAMMALFTVFFTIYKFNRKARVKEMKSIQESIKGKANQRELDDLKLDVGLKASKRDLDTQVKFIRVEIQNINKGVHAKLDLILSKMIPNKK